MANPEHPASMPSAEVETVTDQAPNDQAPEDSMWLDKFTLLFALPSFLISLIVHLVLMAVAAVIVFAGPKVLQVSLDASRTESVSVDDEISLDELEVQDVELQTAELDQPLEQIQPMSEMQVDIPTMSDTVAVVTLPTTLPGLAATADLSNMGQSSTQPFGQRTNEQQRQTMAKENGATAASEAAVEAGLAWLADHQLPDGSWDLNHQAGGGRRRQSPNPGMSDGRIGATGLAILPFLGKGYTHQEGKYKKTVHDGLKFLILAMKDQGPNGGSLTDIRGTLYSHAIGTICLCEAYGMTRDENLLIPAAAAIKYTIYCQDPVGGGWRYQPREPGDTSALGWQLMALKSAQMMNLPAPPRVYDRATKFLNYIQAQGGTEYGYAEKALNGGPGTTAVGVLCRMYLGWTKENPTLVAAVEKMSKVGPDTRSGGEDTEANMYYNYYATQIMRHYGGDEWDKWNGKMRDFLVESQAKEGNAAGSWYFKNGHSSEVGGRLYTTSMAVMTLEVYYRHLPLYKSETLDEEFPLD